MGGVEVNPGPNSTAKDEWMCKFLLSYDVLLLLKSKMRKIAYVEALNSG